jgi:hypothetical protein
MDVNGSKEPIIYVGLIVRMVKEASVLVCIPLVEVCFPWLDGTL